MIILSLCCPFNIRYISAPHQTHVLAKSEKQPP
jgi:hypothetical protein